MKMLKKISSKVNTEAFQHIVVLHINHCMDNSFYFNEIFHSVYKKVIFVAAPYNNRQMEVTEHNYDFYTAMIKDHEYILCRNGGMLNISSHSFADAIYAMIRQAIVTDVMPELKKGAKLLIMEDGGYHYDVMRELAKDHPWILEHVVGAVEQTTSGTRRCIYDGKHYGFMYPCISIARSDIKMNFESIFIGQRVVEELNGFLYSADTFLNFHHVLLIGYGIIGRRVYQSLAPLRSDITVFDHDERIRQTAQKDGAKVVSPITSQVFCNDTIVIGSVGLNSFTEEMLREFMKSESNVLYLASSSSKEIEFIEFIECTRNERSFDGITIVQDLTSKYYTRYQVACDGKSKMIYLIAKGMPVNFYRDDAISLTNRVIDLVFAEMFSLGLALCKKKYEKKLYIFGYDDEMKDVLDEKDLMQQWFEENHYIYQDSLDSFLDIHPDSEYLRERFVEYAIK